MKYSFKLGQQNSKVDLSQVLSLSKAELAEKLNSQIGAFDEITYLRERYDGIYVVKIKKVTKHPDADKLNICLIDDGGANLDPNLQRDYNNLIQVVCGAPNVKDGLSVAWISPGATVPASFDEKEPFTVSKIKLRGIESSGMLASAKELNLSSDHAGILELSLENVEDEKLLQPGTPFKDLFNLDDVIIDFENKMFTHRPDCFGQIGISREIAAIQALNFQSPEWYKDGQDEEILQLAALAQDDKSLGSKLKLNIQNDIPELVPRYSAICIENVKIEPSPIWLQSVLTRLGVRPINNIVDVTNYIMILTGQPLHAFDYSKVAGKASHPELAEGSKNSNSKKEAQILVRKALEGEELKVLSGKNLKLSTQDIVITDGQNPIALGGVMGGANSEVDENTTAIILESANFDMYAIRRTSMRHGLFTDGVTRFTKGQPPAQTLLALLKASTTIQELLPEVKLSKVEDIQQEEFEYDHINLPIQKINNLLGLNLTDTEVEEILNRAEIYTHEMGKMNEVCVTPPFWRQDLHIEEDVIEEIGRIYGFNKIPSTLPMRTSAPARTNSIIKLKSQIRQFLSASGANEVLTYNFVNSKLLEGSNQNPEQAFIIRNALSPDLQKYRLSLMPNLLDKIHQNIKAGFGEFTIFEIGKTHIKDHLESEDGLPSEFQRLSLAYANKNQTSGAPFFTAKKYLTQLLEQLNLSFQFVQLPPEMFGKDIPINSVYNPTRSAGVEIEGELRGVLGEFSASVSKNFKLPESCAGFELDLAWLVEKSTPKLNYQPLNNFPSITQDVTISTPAEEPYGVTLAKLKSGLEDGILRLASLAQDDKFNSKIKFRVQPVSIFQKSKKDDKNTTFSIEFWHPERTLTTKEVSELLEI